jgi:hypothetical protein
MACAHGVKNNESYKNNLYWVPGMSRISISGDHPFARDAAVIALTLKNNGQEKGGNNVTDDRVYGLHQST